MPQALCLQQLYRYLYRLHLSLMWPRSPCENRHAYCLVYEKEKKKKKENEETRLRNFNCDSMWVTTECPAAAADFRGFTLKKKKKERKKSFVSPGGCYLIICSLIDRFFAPSTTLSHVVFASSLYLVIYISFLFSPSQLIFSLIFCYINNIIKLSYYRV